MIFDTIKRVLFLSNIIKMMEVESIDNKFLVSFFLKTSREFNNFQLQRDFFSKVSRDYILYLVYILSIYL